jgi:hypothetical protein
MMDGRVKPGHDAGEIGFTVMADMRISHENPACWRRGAWA